MKRLLLLFSAVIVFASCEVNVVEPVVPYDSRDRILGQYEMEEYSATYDDISYYQITIAKSSYSSREIFIYNFYTLDGKIVAYLDGDRVTIPQQIINDYRISGVGTVHASAIDFNYSVYDMQGELVTDFCESQAR